jgi:hypothetical protein
MAVTPLQGLVNRLIARELNASRRYRCLILQTERLDQQARLCDCLPTAINAIGWQCGVLPWDRFFDTVGALSSDTARDLVLTTGKDRVVVLAGPLHYVDYWTGGVQEGFWNFLSLYSRGPGIVVIDIPRTEGVEGPFVARGILSGTDVRFLRPRLVATEEASL